MSFQVTARRWRPQTFDEVVGQEHVSATLKSAIESGRVAHAYLFAGTRGVGKTTTARILAKALNCEKGPTPEPCNSCTTCNEVTSGSSIDVIEIDGASNRGIEEIRNIRDNVKYAPAKGSYKVYIIDEVHMLTIHAFNALLKTLEEPPPHVVFVLATTEIVKIPATIVSRCQRFDFRLIPLSLIREQLTRIDERDSLNVPSAALEMIARNARGSMRDAQSLLDQLVSYCGAQVNTEDAMAVLGMVDYDVLSACVEALVEGDAASLLGTVEDLRAEGRDPRQFCTQLLRYLRDLVVIKVTEDGASLRDVPQERQDIMVGQAARVPLERLEVLFSMLAAAEGEMVRSSYPDLIMEMALIRMSRSESFMSMGEILSRLDEMEGGLSRGVKGIPGPISTEQGSLLSEDSHEEKRAPADERGERRERSFKGPELQASMDETEAGPPPNNFLPEETLEDQGGGSAQDLLEEDLWQRILFEAGKMNHLEQYLTQGRLAKVSDDEVEIAFSKEYGFTAQLLKQLGKIKDLQEAVSRAVGRRVAVRLKGADPGKGMGEESGEKPVEQAKPWNPMEEPLVQHMINMFGGRIVSDEKGRLPS